MKYVVALLLVGFSLVMPVMASETVLELNNGEYEIPAILHLPSTKQPAPAVLLLHGSASHKNEVGNLYLRLAAQLGEAGIASIRIDFAGTGDSPVSYQKYTLKSAVNDATVALNYLRKLEGVDQSKLGVVGFSQGGLIAQLLLAEQTDITAFVAWSSVAANGIGPFASMFEQHYLNAKANGFVTQHYEWRGPLEISLAWFEQVKTQQSLSKMANFKGALLAIAGSQDRVVIPTSATRLINASNADPARAVVIKGASHIFNVLDPDANQDEQLLSITVDWFKDTL